MEEKECEEEGEGEDGKVEAGHQTGLRYRRREVDFLDRCLLRFQVG